MEAWFAALRTLEIAQAVGQRAVPRGGLRALHAGLGIVTTP